MIRATILAAVAGAVGIVACGLLVADGAAELATAWLPWALLALGMPLGAMTILMIHQLTGGAWGTALRAPLRAMVVTLPLALALLLPLFLAVNAIFPWTQPPEDLPVIVQRKLPYLNVPFFTVRFVACATVWLVLAWLVVGWTAPNERPHRTGVAIGLILQGVAVTVLSIDWMLSLEPEYHSTIYPLLEMSAQIAGAYALAMLAASLRRPVTDVPGGKESVLLSEDLANVLFGFVLVWVYLAYMQYLITWAADLPIEISWYLRRTGGGWQAVLAALILLHAAMPIALCLSRSLKRSRAGALVLSGGVLAGHVCDVFWRLRPPFDAAVGLADAAAAAGVVGLWSTLFLIAFRRLARSGTPQEAEAAHG